MTLFQLKHEASIAISAMREDSEDGASEVLLHPSGGDIEDPIARGSKRTWVQVAQYLAPHALCWLAYTILFVLWFQYRTKQALSIQAETQCKLWIDNTAAPAF